MKGLKTSPSRLAPKPTPVRRPRGFTLIELLTVIAIIGVLAAILIPTISSARVSAQRTVSTSNLRQLGQALHLYANEHAGRFPATTHGNPTSESWVYTLAPYLGNVDEIRICPADPRRRERLQAGATSYVLNEFIAVVERAPFPPHPVTEDFTNLNRIPEPSRTFAAFIGADALPVHITSDHTHSRLWTNWGRVVSDIAPDRFRNGSRHPQRTNGSSPYLFVDGHVVVHPATTVKDWIDEGTNFARPPGL
ncbi:MAG: type II secretion system protein [Puniceicoccaceae bacterium]|nr:MAG: type II secretion system protein [Puniceicoccaceae bacterium]